MAGAAQEEFVKGVQAVERGRMEDALACFHRACGLEPDSVCYQSYRAWTRYHLLGSSPETPELKASCRRVLIDGLERDPRFDAGFVLLGTILLAEGRHDRAREAFKRALAINPANAGARLGLQRANAPR